MAGYDCCHQRAARSPALVYIVMQGCPPVLQRMGFQRAGVIYRSVGVPPAK